MNRTKRAAGLGLTAGLIAGAVTFGAIAVQAAPQEARPFEGILGGSTQAGAPGVGGVPTQSTGTIKATHIGNGTYAITANQDYARHTEDSSQHTMGNCAFLEDNEAGLVITAANGDQIFGDVDDDRSVVCAPNSQGPGGPQPGDVYYSTIFTNVTGGTGRFADASGWLFSEGTSVIGDPTSSPSTDEARIYGDIDY